MDFETATGKRTSACSLALVMIQNSEIVGQYYTLINPQTEFSRFNIAIHHITPQMVQTAPTFAEIWPEIAQFYQRDHLIIAHNAPFDNGVLKACVSEAGFEVPQFLSIDTVKTSKKFFPEWPSHSLDACCRNLGIDLDHHHDALEDSRACANILLKQDYMFVVSSLKKFVTLQN